MYTQYVIKSMQSCKRMHRLTQDGGELKGRAKCVERSTDKERHRSRRTAYNRRTKGIPEGGCLSPVLLYKSGCPGALLALHNHLL